jgi:hypothetical protein
MSSAAGSISAALGTPAQRQAHRFLCLFILAPDRGDWSQGKKQGTTMAGSGPWSLEQQYGSAHPGHDSR